MKHLKQILVFALLLSCFNVQGVNAQGFWKKLGKAAGKVLDSTASSSSSSSSSLSSSSSSSTSNGTANGYIPNVDFKVTECLYWGANVLVRFVVTNNTSDDIDLTIDNTSDNENYVALDENNNRHSFTVVVGGKELIGLGDGYCATLPSGVPVKGYFIAAKVTPGTKMINSLTFAGYVGKDLCHSSGKKYTYKIGSQTISYANNTNKENIFLNLPIMKYDYTKSYRSGKDIIIEGTITNTSTRDYEIRLGDGSKVYDSEGNVYNLSMNVGSKELYRYSSTNIPSDTPIKCQIIVSDVPTNIHKFNLLKAYFDFYNEGYYIQFKNHSF